MKKTLLLLFVFLLASCTKVALPEPTQTPYPTYTRFPSYTIAPTYTAYPTYTKQPSQTPYVITATLLPTLEFTPTITSTPTYPPGVGVEMSCGKKMKITVLDNPDTRLRVGYEQATGVFMVLKVEITNLSSKSFGSLSDSSFRMKGVIDGKAVIFDVNSNASSDYSRGYSWQRFEYDEIPPGLPYRTYVVFDVNPKGEKWYLKFSPTVDSWENAPDECHVSIPIVDKLPGAW